MLSGEIELTLPLCARFERVLDPLDFVLSAWQPKPVLSQRPKGTLNSLHLEVPGLIYRSGFLSEFQESALMAIIDQGTWNRELKRRVQHFGWRYNYKTRRIDEELNLGPLPTWAMSIATQRSASRRIAATRTRPGDRKRVYRRAGHQAGTSIRSALFSRWIAMISLLESWEMVFRRAPNHMVAKVLQHGSVTVMTGDARYRWSHEIPQRAVEPDGSERARRVSVTFRKVRLDKSASKA